MCIRDRCGIDVARLEYLGVFARCFEREGLIGCLLYTSDRMAEHHFGCSIAHDGFDANLSIAALAVCLAVLAIAFVSVWA